MKEAIVQVIGKLVTRRKSLCEIGWGEAVVGVLRLNVCLHLRCKLVISLFSVYCVLI